MIDWKGIIDRLIPESSPEGEGKPDVREILLRHSEAVAKKAVAIVDAHPELGCDRDFVYAAAMLHDIGIIRCDAPSIGCYGSEPYLRHGVLGAEMLRNLQFTIDDLQLSDIERLARVCARHTGTGLPGLEPETWEEKIVCYADKFFSKTRLDREKTYEEARQSLRKFGEEGVKVFDAWHRRLKIED